MSKEATPTTVKDQPEMSAEELQDKFDAPSYAGVRSNDKNVDNSNDWLAPHTYDKNSGTYRLTTEDIIDGRMVINSYEELITDEPVITGKNDDDKRSTAATQQPSTKNNTQPTRKVAETIASRLEKSSKNRKEGRIKSALTAAASKLFKFADKKIQVNGIDSEKTNEARKSLRVKLGDLAITRWWNGLSRNSKDSRDQDGDGFLKRIGNRLKKPDITRRQIGAAALVGAVSTGVFAGTAMAYGEKEQRNNYEYAGVTYGIEKHDNVDKTVLVMGGNYENRPSPELIDEALEQGVNIEGVDWIAQMGPLAGTVDSRISLNDGASTLQQRMSKLAEYGQDTQVISYSWGTVATAEAYHRIKQSDPELYNKLQPPVLYGSPFGKGAFEGPYANIAMGVLGVNPEIAKSLPKGTTFVYSERDPYATSGPNSLPLSALFNIAMIQKGSHGIQEGNDFITIEDEDGNYHQIHRFDAAAALGVTGAGNEELNIAINKLFPMNNDPNSTEKPRADAIGAVFYGAKAIDKMIDPTGNFKLFEKIQAEVPEEWMRLLDNSVNGFNDASLAIMEATNNPTPENVHKAFNAVMSTIGTVNNDLKNALERDMGEDFKNGGVNVASQLISEHFNLDYNTVHRDLSAFANYVEKQAKVIVEQAKAEARARASEQQMTTIHSTDTSRIATPPRLNNPSFTVNVNPAPTPTTPRTSHNNPVQTSAPTRNTEPLAPRATVSAPAAPAPAPVQTQRTQSQRSPETPIAVPEAPVAPPPAPAPAEVATPPTPPSAPVEAAPPPPVIQEAPVAPAEKPSILDIIRGLGPSRRETSPAAPTEAGPSDVANVMPSAPAATTSVDPDSVPAN
jgi:hypothetical protein